MIEIKMIFRSIDEAIVVMGHVRTAMAANKVSPVAKVDVGATSALTQASATQPLPAGESKQRKPRSDAGKPRGAYKTVDAAQKTEAPQGQQSAAAPTPEQQADAAQSPVAVTPGASGKPEEVTADAAQPAVAVAPSDKEVQELLAKYHTKVGTATAMALIESFGAKKARDIAPAKLSEFVAKMKEALDAKP